LSPPQNGRPDIDSIRTYNVRCDSSHKKAQYLSSPYSAHRLEASLFATQIDVRLGSLADVPQCKRPKADMCGALTHVCFGPITDIRFYPSQRAYSGARALRSGMSEILISPLNGSFSSKIK
jgi:hypothetical protein